MGRAQRKKIAFIFLLFSCCVIYSCERGGITETNDPQPDSIQAAKPIDSLFGISLTNYNIIQDTVKDGWTLSHMLLPHNISQFEINLSDQKMKDSLIGLKYVVSGKPYTVFYEKSDTLKKAQYVVYEPDIYSFITFDFSDSLIISKTIRNVQIAEKTISGKIVKNSNLSLEIDKKTKNYTLTAALADAVEGIYAWSIDFFKLQEGDQFVFVYEEKTIDGIPAGIGKIKYAWFEHNGKGKYAFQYFVDSVNSIHGYYDEEGREMKRPFLMSPVKFARMTSSYNLKRMHPIYKKVKPHLGTDYAAPTGTPILATADGVITKASRSGGNGIFVKIKHNSVYETQYLHMSKHAAGIKPGVYVKQGQVIGYVGSTGSATGPHVCYRFWKNGKQVNHRAEKFPNSEPMKKELIPDYLKYIKDLKNQLDQEIINL